MISAWLGRTPPTHYAHALHRETEGNPFFIEEVLRHLIEVGAVDETEWRRLASFTELGIPDGVREAIERRLATLSPAARRVVTMAAAIGRSFPIEVLDALAELPASLLEALEEAAERRIIEEEPGAPGCYAFAHALIRETLYASLSGPRRAGFTAGSARSSRGSTPATPNRRSASLRTISSRLPSRERRPRPSTSRPARPGGRWRRSRTRRPPAISTAHSKPWSFPRLPTSDPLRTAARPRRVP